MLKKIIPYVVVLILIYLAVAFVSWDITIITQIAETGHIQRTIILLLVSFIMYSIYLFYD